MYNSLTNYDVNTPLGDITLHQHWLGYSLVNDGTKTLPELMFYSDWWGALSFTGKQFYSACPGYYSIYIYCIWKTAFVLKWPILVYNALVQSSWLVVTGWRIVYNGDESGQLWSLEISCYNCILTAIKTVLEVNEGLNKYIATFCSFIWLVNGPHKTFINNRNWCRHITRYMHHSIRFWILKFSYYRVSEMCI